MEYSPEIRNRLKRVEGQIRGVLKMMDDEKNCKDVITQLSAVRSAVDRSIGHIVAKNLEICIIDQQEKGERAEDVIKEAVDLLVKSR
jgi:DNA-binding FrmR family transcriptional regulator